MNCKFWGMAGLALILSGCVGDGSFRDRGQDYRRAQLSQPIELPPGMHSETLGDSFRVPGIESHVVLPGNFEVPQPDALVKDVEQGVVRIQRLGDESWILLNGTPGQIWPRLRGFLTVAGISVVHTDAVNGIMDTDWLQPKGEGQEQERYRFRIEQGVQRGSSEIFVLQSRLPAEQGWPDLSSDLERRKEMQMALAQYLADSEAAGSVSMLAQQNVDSQGKVFFKRDDNGQFVQLNLGFERGWASLSLALEKAGFVIEDLNRSEGSYWVTRAQDKEKGGWMSRLFSDDDDNEVAVYVITVQAQSDTQQRITISTQKGAELSAEQAEKMLKRIMGHLT